MNDKNENYAKLGHWMADRRAAFEKRHGKLEDVLGTDRHYQMFVLATGSAPRPLAQMTDAVKDEYYQYRFSRTFAEAMLALATHPLSRTPKYNAIVDRVFAASGVRRGANDRMNQDPAVWIQLAATYAAAMAKASGNPEYAAFAKKATAGSMVARTAMLGYYQATSGKHRVRSDEELAALLGEEEDEALGGAEAKAGDDEASEDGRDEDQASSLLLGSPRKREARGDSGSDECANWEQLNSDPPAGTPVAGGEYGHSGTIF